MTRPVPCLCVAVLCLVGAAPPVAAAQLPAAPSPAGLSSRTTTAVTYEARRTTKIDLVGTPLLPHARGEAEIRTEAPDPVRIKAKVRHMLPLVQVGSEYLTYVLWAVPPQGRAKNLGELRLDDGAAEIEVTSDVQTFALLVTAEPYYAVTTPSDTVVMDTAVRQDTRGTSIVTLQHEIVPWGAYIAVARARYALPVPGPYEPPDVQQARNAVAIAQIAQADRYASQALATAQRLLTQVERLVTSGGGEQDIVSQARTAVQVAEAARLQSVVGRRAVEAQETARAAAAAREQAAHDRVVLRATLLRQFGAMLDTRDTARGPVVTVGDVLFKTGGYELRPAGRETLARFAGIVLGHPGLMVQVEGFTDSTGSPAVNEALSERRAGAVGEFLTAQGLPRDRVTSRGLGANEPVATNDTPEGRSQNRRVELVVSGDVIGAPIGAPHR